MHQRRNNGNSNHNNISSNSNSNSKNSSSSSNMYGNRGVGHYDVEGGGSAVGSGAAGFRGRGAGGSGLSANDTNKNIMEQQNNERIHELSEHVARLKGLTLEIGNEVREQNALLDGMGDGFQNTRDMLSNSLMRIGTMLESGGMKHMCYLVIFAVAVIIFLWWLMSYKGTSGA